MKIFVIAAFFYTNSLTLSLAQECLEFVVGGGVSAMKSAGLKLSEEFARNGVCNKITFLPSKRATKVFLAGNVDGEIGRIQFYKDVVGDNGVKIPTPIFTYSGSFVTKDKNITSLSQITNHLGIVRGWVWMKKVGQMIPNVRKIEVNNFKNLIEMFEKDRLKVILISSVSMDRLKLRDKYPNYKVIDLYSYVWLNPTHKKYIGKLDKIIFEYLKSGKTF